MNIIKKNIVKIVLASIILLALLLRLWQIGVVPSSIDWDEAALGYNAYSIMLSGRDEYGVLFPSVIQSFGDYKPALYSYLIIPFIPLFGLSEIAVRLPSALFGVFAVFVTYLLVKELTKRNDVSFLSSFLLAISPWHIQFSRVAFEANIGLTFNLLGMLFFLKGLKKPRLLSLSSVFFVLSLYAYQSEKLFVPLMIFILITVYWKKIVVLHKKFLIVGFVVLIVASLPIDIFTITNKNAFARAQGVSFFSQKTGLLQNNITRLEFEHKNNDVLGLIFDNRRVIYAKTIVDGYLSHFDLNWWFFKGDTIARHHAPFMALLYVVEIPFLLIGLYVLFFSKKIPLEKRTKVFLLLWFLVTPISASLTTGVPHAVRTLNFLPTLQIFISLGLLASHFWIQKNQLIGKYSLIRYISYGLFLIICLYNFSYYIDQYFVQTNYFAARDWQYGYKKLVSFIAPVHNNYSRVIVSNSKDFDQSYIFFLFYLSYDPRLYQAQRSIKDGHNFSNFEFRDFNYAKETGRSVLFIGTKDNFSSVLPPQFTIRYPDGTESMQIVEK